MSKVSVSLLSKNKLLLLDIMVKSLRAYYYKTVDIH